MEQARSRTPGQGAGAPARPGDALAALRLAWGGAYEFGHDRRGYWARRRGGGGVITAAGPDRLLDRVRGDYIARSEAGEAGRAAAIAAIAAEFGAWRVWVSDHGHWYAVRQGPAGRYERGVSGPITLDAADAAGLRAELALAAEAALAALAGLAAAS
jgi:hypothetical protein